MAIPVWMIIIVVATIVIIYNFIVSNRNDTEYSHVHTCIFIMWFSCAVGILFILAMTTWRRTIVNYLDNNILPLLDYVVFTI